MSFLMKYLLAEMNERHRELHADDMRRAGIERGQVEKPGPLMTLRILAF